LKCRLAKPRVEVVEAAPAVSAQAIPNRAGRRTEVAVNPRTERHEVTRKRVLYEAPGADKVTIRQGLEYSRTDDLVRTLDVYYPPEWTGATSAPAVLFVSGLSDLGARAFLGCCINEMEGYISWGRLVAASGLIGVTYRTGPDPAADTGAVLEHLRTRGGTLGIDAARLGLWACSSHVPNALGQVMDRSQSIACAVLCYGFMLDLDGATGVADARRSLPFANPSAGKTVDDLPPDVPLFIARAGRDVNPGLNDSIDRFLSHAVRRNLPVTFVNHPAGPHAFDLDDDSDTTRAIVKGILTFLRLQLVGSSRVAHPERGSGRI
jgi:hypothetical protein